MGSMEYLKMLVEEIHSATIATIGEDGYPQTRIIDIMLYDERGVYILTARGKAFYKQLMEQGFVAVSATKDKRAISLRGKTENIGKEKLDEIFEKNSYMKEIYPEGKRQALEVFRIYEAQGEYFDISDPAHIERASIVIGDVKSEKNGFYVGAECVGCKRCYLQCPQECIDISKVPVVINQNHCLHCGNCVEICPKHAIKKVG